MSFSLACTMLEKATVATTSATRRTLTAQHETISTWMSPNRTLKLHRHETESRSSMMSNNTTAKMSTRSSPSSDRTAESRSRSCRCAR